MDTALTLAWVAPESDGGAAITNYVIEFRMEGQLQWKRLTENTIEKLTHRATKLQEGQTYEFRVAAENKAGQGPFSDPSAPVLVKEPIGKYISSAYLNITLKLAVLLI